MLVSGQPKVDDPRKAPAIDYDVGGFEISMDQFMLMSKRDCISNLGDQMTRVLDRHRQRLRIQRWSVEPFGHQERSLAPEPKVVNATDPRVFQAGKPSGFASKTLERLSRWLTLERFDRDVTLQILDVLYADQRSLIAHLVPVLRQYMGGWSGDL